MLSFLNNGYCIPQLFPSDKIPNLQVKITGIEIELRNLLRLQESIEQAARSSKELELKLIGEERTRLQETLALLIVEKESL